MFFTALNAKGLNLRHHKLRGAESYFHLNQKQAEREKEDSEMGEWDVGVMLLLYNRGEDSDG